MGTEPERSAEHASMARGGRRAVPQAATRPLETVSTSEKPELSIHHLAGRLAFGLGLSKGALPH